MSTQIDDDAVELSYSEYVEEAKKLQAEGWSSFIIYPERSGVVYCKAYNQHNQNYRLLTITEYVTLRDSGEWAKGVDRLRGTKTGSQVKAAKMSAIDKKKLAKYDKAIEALVVARKTYTDYDSLGAAVDTILRSMINL